MLGKKQFRPEIFVPSPKLPARDRWECRAKMAAVIRRAMKKRKNGSTYCREYGLIPEQLGGLKGGL